MARARFLEGPVLLLKGRGVQRNAAVDSRMETISLEEIRGWAEQTEDILSTLIEAGLGKDSRTEGKVKACIEQLANARKLASANRLADAAACLSLADMELHNAFHAKGWWWRLGRYLPLIFIYLVIVLFVILNAATGWRPPYLEGLPLLADKVWGVPVAVMGWGSIGGVLRGLYWSHRQVGNRIYRDSFTLFHLSSPLIGALFGAIVYLVLTGGLIILEGGQENGIENIALVHATALICGFHWKSLLDWIYSYRFGSRGGRSSGEVPAKGDRKGAESGKGKGS